MKKRRTKAEKKLAKRIGEMLDLPLLMKFSRLYLVGDTPQHFYYGEGNKKVKK